MNRHNTTEWFSKLDLVARAVPIDIDNGAYGACGQRFALAFTWTAEALQC